MEEKKKIVRFNRCKAKSRNTFFVKEEYSAFEDCKEEYWTKEDFCIYKSGKFFFVSIKSLIEKNLRYNYFFLFPNQNGEYTLAQLINTIGFCVEFNFVVIPMKNKRELLSYVDIGKIVMYDPQQLVDESLKGYLRAPAEADVDELMIALKYYL